MERRYKVVLSVKAKKELKSFDRYTYDYIKNWIYKNLQNCINPKAIGKPLEGKLKDYWCYRIGDYRLICDIKDDHLLIMVISADHRKNVYERKI